MSSIALIANFIPFFNPTKFSHNMRLLLFFGSFLFLASNQSPLNSKRATFGVAPTITLEKNGKIETHFRPPFRIKKGTRLA
jgi:hypothetical protein